MENRDSESNKNPESKSTLGVIDKIGFSFGHILNDLTAGLWFSYTLLYLKSIVELPHFWAGFLMMLGQVFDAASTCIVGILTDKFNSKRIWHIFGTFLVIISFPLIFIKLSVLNDEDSLTWKISYYAFWIFIFQFGWPICQICHLGL
jgi:Na+/melibiose symporter-like transporter